MKREFFRNRFKTLNPPESMDMNAWFFRRVHHFSSSKLERAKESPQARHDTNACGISVSGRNECAMKPLTVCFSALLLFSGCSKSTVEPTPSATITFPPGTVGLRADPNPVPANVGNGKTTVGWQTGTAETGEVYLVEEKGERLFARGPSGSSDAPWIAPGSTRFRLYRGTDHREVLAELIVTMGRSASAGATTTPTPASSP